MNTKSWLYGEPDIADMLSDPIVRLVMRRDAVGDVEVWRAIRRAQGQLTAVNEDKPALAAVA
jgi:hypothetical protein